MGAAHRDRRFRAKDLQQLGDFRFAAEKKVRVLFAKARKTAVWADELKGRALLRAAKRYPSEKVEPMGETYDVLRAQADDYASVVRACRETPRCVGVTSWGLTDDRSWVPSFFSGYCAALPFDEGYRPKPAVTAIIEGFTEKAP